MSCTEQCLLTYVHKTSNCLPARQIGIYHQLQLSLVLWYQLSLMFKGQLKSTMEQDEPQKVPVDLLTHPYLVPLHPLLHLLRPPHLPVPQLLLLLTSDMTWFTQRMPFIHLPMHFRSTPYWTTSLPFHLLTHSHHLRS